MLPPMKWEKSSVCLRRYSNLLPEADCWPPSWMAGVEVPLVLGDSELSTSILAVFTLSLCDRNYFRSEIHKFYL